MKKSKSIPKKNDLLETGKILLEVKQRMIKGEHVDVIIGRTDDTVYVDSDDNVIYPENKKKEDLKQYTKRTVKTDDLRKQLEKILKARKVSITQCNIQVTDYYISATLGPDTIKEIAGEIKGKKGIKWIDRIWYNKKIRATLDISNNTIKSTAVKNVFNVKGEGIVWAIIDTGIDKNNGLIGSRVEEQFDFTSEGIGDQNGHGTHVAGIIASQSKDYPGIAPETKLYDFKVLNQNGEGSEFGVIQAMEKIRKLNNDARKIVIHGANISLGSPPEVGSFGVGASPVCREANRLVHSGVVVCVAASNDGYKILAAFKSSTQVEYFRTFQDITISDPGNAEEVITIGSVHKTNPHTYGISYFSSKGPTGDGRYKPDVVAPGERIKSLGLSKNNQQDGVEMSGTSMSTPHVSGSLALFLSAKPEFIGHPQKVKKILMENCTDLKRDRYFQGSGLIDIFRTIQAV